MGPCPRNCWDTAHTVEKALGGLVGDAFDLAAVDAQFAGDGALAVPGLVPGPDRLLQGRRPGQGKRRIALLLVGTADTRDDRIGATAQPGAQERGDGQQPSSEADPAPAELRAGNPAQAGSRPLRDSRLSWRWLG